MKSPGAKSREGILGGVLVGGVGARRAVGVSEMRRSNHLMSVPLWDQINGVSQWVSVSSATLVMWSSSGQDGAEDKPPTDDVLAQVQQRHLPEPGHDAQGGHPGLYLPGQEVWQGRDQSGGAQATVPNSAWTKDRAGTGAHPARTDEDSEQVIESFLLSFFFRNDENKMLPPWFL